MGAKLGSLFFCLLFAVPFGGVGVFATWAITGMVRQSATVADWVVAKAKIEEASLRTNRGSKGGSSYEALGKYRYTFQGTEYTGTQLGLYSLSASDSIGNWQRDMATYLIDAKKKGRQISVYVNPDDPAQAVVDRDLRWGLVAFLGTFGLVFGAVGLGALIAAGYVLFSSEDKKRLSRADKRRARSRAVRTHEASPAAALGEITSDAGAGLAGAWIFSFFWNAISFPIAFLAVPRILADREYWALFVLLFPMIGVLVLWFAIVSTWGYVRRGKATLRLEPERPRGGQIFTGNIEFARGVLPGETFEVRLQRERKAKSPRRQTASADWSREVTANTSSGPRGTRLVFKIGAPASKVPADSQGNHGEYVWYEWRIETKPAGSKGPVYYGFPIRIEPKAGDASRDDDVAPEPESIPVQLQTEALFNPRLAAANRMHQSIVEKSQAETRARNIRTRLLKGVLITVAILGFAWVAYDSYVLHYANP